MLANVFEIEFNKFPAFIAPDKSNWFGVWSNDGPESLKVLAMTNAAKLAKECIVHYIRTSINKDGILAWYTTGCGEPCFGKADDTGKRSHGVPIIAHTVDYYIRSTGDRSILEENAGDDFTVWEKLKRYVMNVFKHRDINNDGLVEWVNLWETGWDDKASPFFSRAVLDEWIKIMANGSGKEIEDFYKENNCPVTALVDQTYMLWALNAFKNICLMRKEAELACFCDLKINDTLKVVTTRHWDEEAGFYFDWDVRNNCLTREKNLDAFYFMYFENDKKRLKKLIEHMESTNEFGLRHIPTLSADSNGFRADGYWCGGYWPRESSYVGLALNRQGFKAKAMEFVLSALCCHEGCIIPENMNSKTGAMNTRVTKMAYNGLLNLTLLEINGKKSLWEPAFRRPHRCAVSFF